MLRPGPPSGAARSPTASALEHAPPSPDILPLPASSRFVGAISSPSVRHDGYLGGCRNQRSSFRELMEPSRVSPVDETARRPSVRDSPPLCSRSISESAAQPNAIWSTFLLALFLVVTRGDSPLHVETGSAFRRRPLSHRFGPGTRPAVAGHPPS